MLKISFFTVISFLISVQTFAGVRSGKYFDRVITVIFENKNYADAMKQPFFQELARTGANFSNFYGMTHPSQPNYIALTSGSMQGVTSNDVVNIDSTNVIDLLEAKGITWKVYAEDYPGNCYTGATSRNYARKHNPFISYLNIQKNSARCANIVDASQFDRDASDGSLASYVFYIPNNKNNGHDTTIAYADRWYSQTFRKFVSGNRMLANTILVSTFDESEPLAPRNQIYTSIVGPTVKAVQISSALNLYSLLNLVEDNWDLGNLGREDATAAVIPYIWK